MKKYVVAVINFFDNDLKQFKVEADSDYEAFKKAMLEFCETEETKKFELEFQNHPDYPKIIEDLEEHYLNCEITFSVTEVKEY